jgi:hypothetical protein
MSLSRTSWPYLAISLLVPLVCVAQAETQFVAFETTQELEQVMLEQAEPDASLTQAAAFQDYKKRLKQHIELLKLDKPPLPFVAWCEVFLKLARESAQYDHGVLLSKITKLIAEIESCKANAVALGAFEIARRLGSHEESMLALGEYLGTHEKPSSKEKLTQVSRLIKWIKATLNLTK